MNNLSGYSVVVARHCDNHFARCSECLVRLQSSEIVALTGARSLFEAYDRGRRQARCERVLFVHEDVEVESLDETVLDEILDRPDTGFVGVAGSRMLDGAATWWKWIREPDKERWLSGRCGHRTHNKIMLNRYGHFGEVAVLDGVFLAVTKRTLETIGGFADAPLDGFDFYDISATFRARLAGLKNYTMPVDLFHWGLGVPRPGWEHARAAFLEKYASYLPYSIDPALVDGDRHGPIENGHT